MALIQIRLGDRTLERPFCGYTGGYIACLGDIMVTGLCTMYKADQQRLITFMGRRGSAC